MSVIDPQFLPDLQASRRAWRPFSRQHGGGHAEPGADTRQGIAKLHRVEKLAADLACRQAGAFLSAARDVQASHIKSTARSVSRDFFIGWKLL